ncbi:uncharacterized protein LOC120477297 [Pimephales promelas]|uniref:uncharacterized protein LOC120477297 n=1 Tax=Pimephales promelas TaxID=90988 RepID=UPI001955A5B0|nr:uncharacterized protein LOC120477297 [Pimephales promelas]KAG1928205.1 hypothetical protein F2P79_023732 [Pimephales promelas]
MASKRLWCSVLGCNNEHISHFDVPKSEPLKTQWLSFVFKGNIPSRQRQYYHVCANHFSPDCFINEGQYKAGFAKKLLLKKQSVPTIRVPAAPPEKASTSKELDMAQHVASQKKMCTVGTQLSMESRQYKSTGTQTTMLYPDTGVGQSVPLLSSSSLLTTPPLKRPNKRSRLELEEEEEGPSGTSSSMNVEEPLDSTYDPDDSVTNLSEPTDVIFESSKPVHKTATYIVYENCLLQLFEQCPVCQRITNVQRKVFGTFLSVEQRCPNCDFFRKWNSQPIIQSTPAGNLQLSVAVYANGASFFKVKKIFQAMKLKMIHYTTFRIHARRYIQPAIVHSWKTAQDGMLQKLRQQQNIVLGGDMRADSPGHSAKFGSYSLMDLRTSTIIDLQLVQSNEVGGSNNMEKEGLRRSLDLLRAHGVTFDSIVTNRHPQIQKHLREANIKQYYNVWHIEKGVSKKLRKIAQNKDSEKLQKWYRSIKNHIYWTAASSSSGTERVAKWTSILNHIQDVHTHDDPVFPQCLHPQSTTTDKSKWMRAGTTAFSRLEKILRNKRILKDVEKLSPHHQTSSLEAFHGVILRFVPKNVVFSFLGMLCRLYLAGLHFNENAGRPQATTAAGEPLFKVVFPKHKKGQYFAKPVKFEPTFQYVDNLLELIFENVVVDRTPYMDDILKISVPEDLTSQFDKPEKQEVIDSYVSRFNQGQV